MREERESDIGKTRAKGSPTERRRRSGGVRPQGKIGQGQSRGEGRWKSENTQQKGAGNEIQLTDAIKRLMDIQAVYAYDFEGIRYDVGDKFGFVKATIDFALKRDDLKEKVEEHLKTIIAVD